MNTQRAWFKSSYSSDEGGACIEDRSRLAQVELQRR